MIKFIRNNYIRVTSLALVKKWGEAPGESMISTGGKRVMETSDKIGDMLECLENAQLLHALPEGAQPALPPVDWRQLNAPPESVPVTVKLANWRSFDPCPKADIVVITWTVAEWAAMNQVLTDRREPLTPEQAKGKDWRSGWVKYQRDYCRIYQYMTNVAKSGQGGAPSLSEEAWGSLRLIRIGELRVLLVKSGMHLAQDGSELPLTSLIERLCVEAEPRLVLSIGTAGAVRPQDALGSVLITNQAVFHCTRRFAGANFNDKTFRSDWAPDERYFDNVQSALFQPSGPTILPISPQYPADALIEPDAPDARIKVVDTPIITADTFLFGSTSNGLEKYGCIVEMDDAVVAMVCDDYDVPYGFVRNASDPVMNGELPYELQDSWAGYIYQQQGLYTSFNGALATWALLAAEAARAEEQR